MVRGNQWYRGGAASALRVSRKKRSFLRPPHVRNFVEDGYFFGNPGTKYEA